MEDKLIDILQNFSNDENYNELNAVDDIFRLFFVSNSFCDLNKDYQDYLIKQGETKCKQCGKRLKAK
jgi:hypothetical protein